MAPVAYAVLFAVPAAGAALLAGRRPRARWLPWLIGILTFLSAYSVLLLATTLYDSARLIVAAGLAVRLGTLAAQHEPRVRRWLAPVLATLALACLALGGGYNILISVRERRALAALPAARPGEPNILFLIWDTVRAPELELYGYPRPTTPNLDRLARRGVAFDYAISTAPWTLPSHAGMFTGLYPHQLSAGWTRPLDDRHPTIAEVLAAHGYVTAGFVANTFYTSRETGLARGMAHFEDFGFTPGNFLMSTALGRMLANDRPLREAMGNVQLPGRKTADRIDGDFLRWLGRRPAGHPFFAFLNYYDAHSPYLPPAPYDTLFQAHRQDRKPLIWMGWLMTPAQVRAERDAYDASIAYLDSRLGTLVDSLRARGLLDNTIVVLAADHGEEFGEHGVFTHGNSLYIPSLHVPLVIVGPGVSPARRVPHMVSLRDIPATLLDLAGIRRSPFPGASLARFWREGPAERGPAVPLVAEVGKASNVPGRYPVAVGDMHSVFTDGFHLIIDGNGREELYDLRQDPGEKHDLLTGALPARPPGARP